ncbi:MAG: universal stress protein [Saprospiraceae bacterium]|nr:universal stress protein [Saprospiraceae bacterium]
MKKILVPTDFSACANSASEYGIQLAKLASAEIHFLHLQSTPVNWLKLSKEKEKKYPETLKAIGRARFELNKWVNKARANGLKAEHALIFDGGKEQIFRHLENHNHDFLIMGSHGVEGIQEKVVGSNAQKILRNASVPVLVIKKPVFDPIENILFVSDFSDVSKDSFHTLTHFADVLEAHIDLLFVNTPKGFKESKETSKNMDMVMTHCNREESCTRNVINASTIEEGIKNFTNDNPIDLIAICTHGKSSLRQLFSPSIAEQVANHTLLPLLSIKL